MEVESDVLKEVSSDAKTQVAGMLQLLSVATDNREIARIYDSILARIQQLLQPLRKNKDEYWDDQKELFYFLVKKMLSADEIVFARERFRKDLEDFFSKKSPLFEWKGLGLKDLLDLAINVPLSLADITKVVLTKSGQFIISRAERAIHNHETGKHSVQDESEIIDGHIISSSEKVILPFLRFVRASPDYDHPVIFSLYAYWMHVLDRLNSIFQYGHNHRSNNLFTKLTKLRNELSEIIYMPRLPANLRGEALRLLRLLSEQKKAAKKA